MIQIYEVTFKPFQGFKHLYEKPIIWIPLLLALITPLFIYKNVVEILPEKLQELSGVIIVSSMIFSLFSYFITSFLIYLLCSVVFISKSISFAQIMSIYGFTQIPKVFQSIFHFTGILPITLRPTTIEDKLIDSVLLNPFFYWEAFLLIVGITILFKTKVSRAISVYVIFFVIKTIAEFIIFNR